MTKTSRSAPRRAGHPPGPTVRSRGPGRARAVAWALLALHAVGASVASSCLPPDFEILPRVNHPITIDKALLTVSPDVFQTLVCEPKTFDLSNAIVDEDEDDPRTIAWLVDYFPGQSLEPDAINRLRFTFDPCTKPGSDISTIEALVLDRPVPLEILADADLLKAFVDDDVTSDSVIWFVGYDRGCPCGGL